MINVIHKIKHFFLFVFTFLKTQLSKIKRPAFMVAITESESYKRTISFLNKYCLILHIPFSMIICFVLEWMSRHSFMNALDFIIHHHIAFFYNSYMIYVLLSPVFLIRRRTFLRMIIVFILVALGIINSIVLLNRVTPFGFTDLYMVGDLLTMQNTQYFSRTQGFLLSGIVFVYALLMIVLFIKGHKQNLKMKLPVRIALVLFLLITFFPFTTFLQSHNLMASYFGNLAQGYRDYGFLYGFSTSIYGRGMEKPFGYGSALISNIIEDTDMGESNVSAENMPNVVVVLLESFFDVSEANFLETDKDPIPYFHELEENYSSGYCTVPVVGAGTCNTEFEVLTGMSCQFFGPGEYPQKTILKETDCESFADVFKDMGLSSHVVHNNGGNFYSRANAFSMMGFDSFTCKETLDITEWTPLGSWPTDEILIDATKDALDSTEGSDFVYTITVETHGNYPEEVIVEHPFTSLSANGKEESLENQWSYYTEMLHREDLFLRDYIKMLKERNEDTLVIMFGDHLPTLGLNADELKSKDLYKTKYITWNNFGMEKEDKDLTSYQLVSEYLNRLGIHGGTILNYNQAKINQNVRPGSFSYMNGLEALQYDLLYGERYAYNKSDRYPASDLTMGIRDVKINRVYPFAGKLHIYGENFTQWSSVFVDGEKIPTTYESGECLSIPLGNIKNGQSLFVGQVGSNDTIFRQSNQLRYFN